MIYIFTHSYPYARRGEVFLNDEMRAVRALGLTDRICFVPLRREAGVAEPVCPAVRCEPFLLGGSGLRVVWRKVYLLVGMLSQSLFWRIPADFNPELSVFANIGQGGKYFYVAWAYADWIRRNRARLRDGDVLYSYWMHYNVLGMALAKRQGWLPAGLRCVSRGHRYDLYEEQVGRYFPYRRMSLAVADGLFPCSENGAAFLRQRYPDFADKIQSAFLGVWPVDGDDVARMQALRPVKGVVRVVSCSSVSPVKRLPLLWRSLAVFSQGLPSGTVLEWHHFGGGVGLAALQAEAVTAASRFPALRIVWHGQTANAAVREAYLATYFHVFVNVSESEGVPVSLMEACAAGIPVLATDAGGSGELVRLAGGRLLPVDFDQATFDEALGTLLQAGEEARLAAYRCYSNYFSAEKNYTAYYRRLFG